VAVEPVHRVSEARAAQRSDAPQAPVVAEARHDGRLLVEVVDPVADVSPLDGGPPRPVVVGPGPGHGGVDGGVELRDLGG
jgi:hypothetical protein